MTNKAYLLIGGNIGDREANLQQARAGLERTCGRLTAQSALYQTAAWGLHNQAPFLNQAVALETALTADELLRRILAVEASLGRKRDVKYGPRTVDIDVIFFGDAVVKTEGLTVPHPHLQARRFVLVPLQEIAPDLLHPVFKQTVTQLLDACPDNLAVQKFH